MLQVVVPPSSDPIWELLWCQARESGGVRWQLEDVDEDTKVAAIHEEEAWRYDKGVGGYTAFRKGMWSSCGPYVTSILGF